MFDDLLKSSLCSKIVEIYRKILAYPEAIAPLRDMVSIVQFQKKIHTHPMEGHWKFLGGGGGVLQAKILEAKYEAILEFPGRGAKQKPSVGVVWIFSGTAHCYFMLITKK